MTADSPTVIASSGHHDAQTPQAVQDFEPKIIAMLCTYCTYTAADMAGSMRLQYPSNVRIVKLLCTGRVDLLHILDGFYAGADGILVGG